MQAWYDSRGFEKWRRGADEHRHEAVKKATQPGTADPIVLRCSRKELQACSWVTKRKGKEHLTYIKGTVYNKIRCNMNLQSGKETARCKSVLANI